MTQALYHIANDYAKLSNSDFTPEEMADTLNMIEGELEDKAANIMGLIKNESAYSAMLREEAANLLERAKRSDNKVDGLKTYLAASLDTTGLKSLRAGSHQVSVRAGSKSVVIENVDLLPIEYVEYETVTKPDKNLIKEKLKAGVEVAGALLKTGKPSLIIK